jgi:hypothetical protein
MNLAFSIEKAGFSPICRKRVNLHKNARSQRLFGKNCPATLWGRGYVPREPAARDEKGPA